MSESKELFSHSAPVFAVGNVEESIDFYCSKLGFNLTFKWNDPVDYAVIKRGNIGIHLTKRQDHLEPSEVHTAVFIFVHDVDTVYKEFKARQVDILNPVGDRDYRMRDFDIKDPDGYILTFGMGLD